jgi:hypothetical protein
MGSLAAIGIVKGKPFALDARMKKVRAAINWRSSSATAPRICKVKTPCGVEVSIGSPNDRNPAPRACSCSITSRRC